MLLQPRNTHRLLQLPRSEISFQKSRTTLPRCREAGHRVSGTTAPHNVQEPAGPASSVGQQVPAKEEAPANKVGAFFLLLNGISRDLLGITPSRG